MSLKFLKAGAVWLAAWTSIAGTPAAAADGQVADLGDDKGESVVVTANRVPTEQTRVASSISVITDVEMEQQQTRFVMDILQTTPGLSISQFGARGTDSNVFIRGQGAENILVLMDGVEVSDPSRSQTAFDFSQLLAGNIARVEVLRGSQSVLYGGEAVGGVINVISKRGEGPTHGSIFAEYGSYDTYLVSGQASGGAFDDRFGYSVNLQYLDTDGFSAADKNLPGNTEGEKYHNFSSNGRFDLKLADFLDASAVYRYAGGHLNYDACGGAYCDDSDVGDDFKQYSGRLATAFHALDGKLNGELGVAYSRNERHGVDDGAPSYYYIGQRTKFDFQGSYNFTDDHFVVFGAETKKDEYAADTDPVGASVRNSGYYALYQGTFLDALTVSLGGRIDDNQRFGGHGTWRVTAAYNIADSDTKLKGSYATGFRAPSLFELFGRCCGDPNLGNPDLKPEKSKSWDAGVEQRFLGGAIKAEVVYFNLRTSNEIVYVGANFGSPDPDYYNVAGTTKSEGVETSLFWQATDNLTVDLAYTYNMVRTDAGVRLQNRPKNVFNANVNYAFLDGRANVNFNIRHTSGSLDSDFSTWPATIVSLGSPVVANLALRYKLTDKVELSARVENLTDEKYETEFGYGTAGLSFYGGARFNF